MLIVATGLQPIHRNAGTPDVPFTIEHDPRVSKATRELYDHPDTYEERRDELNHEIRPKT